MKREYHLRFNRMERYILGEAVIGVLDASKKKTMLVYELFAAVITMLGARDKSSEEIINAFEEWIDETLYKKKGAPARKESTPTPNPAQSAGGSDMSMFMGNSSFSDFIGGA